ncbi:MAG: ABC transporter ATP-binding protein [Phototrophicales bacterium]|nr:MAG: ABC transporter ATP-binding protein [Phototrophicales bacterium]
MSIFGGLTADKYDRQYDDGYLLSRLGGYFAPYRRQVFILAALVIVFALVGAIIPVAISTGINLLEANAPDSVVIALVIALFVIAFLDYFLYQLRRVFLTRVVADVISNVRKDAFAAAIDRDLAFYDENKSGKIVSRITNDTQELSQVIMLSSEILGQILEFAVLLVVMVLLEWRLTLVMLGTIPIVFAATMIFRYFARIVTRQGARAMALVNDNIQESVTGISVAKNFRQEAMIYSEFRAINDQSYRVNLRRGGVLALVFPTMNALAGVAIAAVVYFGGMLAQSGSVDSGVWFLFIQGVDRFWFPLINLSSFWSQLQAGLSAAERIFALIDAENTVRQTGDLPAPLTLRGAVRFEDVTFAYKTGEKVLEHFNLDIEPGESIAFVGHTGAGKSSIIKLLARFYEFQGGRILVDGTDIRQFNLSSYRSRLGIVPQQPFLFRGTIKDNIRYARPDMTDAEIEEIAYSIGGGEWLETIPDGLMTDVGERGAHLSMGQRQLVSLMRVLAQKPSIFILDEATASIDPFTEAQIQEALDLILAQSTSFLIAHRLSTVRSADRIIVLRQGKIIEQGSHDTLMASGGHYAELYDTYFRHQSLEYLNTNPAARFASAAR